MGRLPRAPALNPNQRVAERLRAVERRATTSAIAPPSGGGSLDDDLASIAATDPTVADKMLYTTGAHAWALATITGFGRNLLDDANAAAARTTLEASKMTLHTTTATTSGPTTTDTTNPPTALMPEMEITADFGGHPILAIFSAVFTNNVASAVSRMAIRDHTAGATLGTSQRNRQESVAGNQFTLTTFAAVTPAAGSRTIRGVWGAASGTLTGVTTTRQLAIVEFG